MGPERRLTELELLAGDPALDFANTLEGPGGAPPEIDWLRDHGTLVDWAEHAQLLEAAAAAELHALARRHPRAAAAAHRDGTRLRDAAADAFLALAAGNPAPQPALAVLLRSHADALAHAELVAAERGYALAWPAADLRRPWWPVARSAVDLLRSERLARVKRCARCRWLFLDETKNRSRRWCSMADCGTAEKLERRAAARTGSGLREP